MRKLLVNFARRTDMKIVFGVGVFTGAFLTRIAQEHGNLTRNELAKDYGIVRQRDGLEWQRQAERHRLIMITKNLKDRGLSNVEIGKVISCDESVVRKLLSAAH